MKTLLLLYCLASLALAGQVGIEWDANPEPDITGYRVHCGTASGTYTRTVFSMTPSAAIPDLAPGTWYFAVTAINAAGLESPRSVEISTVIPEPPVPPTAPKNPRFILQSSTDLREWQDEIEILNKPAGRKFWRIATLAAN